MAPARRGSPVAWCVGFFLPCGPAAAMRKVRAPEKVSDEPVFHGIIAAQRGVSEERAIRRILYESNEGLVPR